MTLRIKAGVKLPPAVAMAVLLRVAEDAFSLRDSSCTLTSGLEGKHGVKSLHPKGRALDFRTFELSAGADQSVAEYMQACLGDDFDVVVEPDHIHAEYDPK